MTVNQLIPAAQYLRMSTEHQQYSLENQYLAIQKYAESHGFEVVRTYSDTAKSGLVLRRRAGLQQLLKDVVGGTSGYRAILVYDVSRWGRFQDTDESRPLRIPLQIRRRSSPLLCRDLCKRRHLPKPNYEGAQTHDGR